MAKGEEYDRLRAELRAARAKADHYQAEAKKLATQVQDLTARVREQRKLVESHQRRAEDAGEQLERLQRENDGATRLIAEMHAAARGEVIGPLQGPIGDIVMLREERDKLKSALRVVGR